MRNISNYLKKEFLTIPFVVLIPTLIFFLDIVPYDSEFLLYAIIELLAYVIILSFVIKQDLFNQLNTTQIVKFSWLITSVLFLFVIVYYFLYQNFYYYSSDYDERILLPFFPSDKLQQIIINNNGIENYLKNYGITALNNDILSCSKKQYIITRFTFVAIFIFIYELIVFLFLLLTKYIRLRNIKPI